jgi:hypothetical protein
VGIKTEDKMRLLLYILFASNLTFAAFHVDVREMETYLKKSTKSSKLLKYSTEKCTMFSKNRYELSKRAKRDGVHYFVELTEEIHVDVEPSVNPPITGVKCTSYSTGYYPHNSRLEGGYYDRFGAKLRTLQDYLAGKVKYVTVAMDKPYSRGLGKSGGRRVRIPELERKYNNGNFIDFRVLDTGSAFYYKGAKKIDICMKGYRETLDSRINKKIDIYFVDGDITCDE